MVSLYPFSCSSFIYEFQLLFFGMVISVHELLTLGLLPILFTGDMSNRKFRNDKRVHLGALKYSESTSSMYVYPIHIAY